MVKYCEVFLILKKNFLEINIINSKGSKINYIDNLFEHKKKNTVNIYAKL